MFRRVLASLGLLVLVLSACDQRLLIAAPGSYEIVALTAD